MARAGGACECGCGHFFADDLMNMNNWTASGNAGSPTYSWPTAYGGGVRRVDVSNGVESYLYNAAANTRGGGAGTPARTQWGMYTRFRYTQRTPDANTYFYFGTPSGALMGFRGAASATKFSFSKDGWGTNTQSSVDAVVGDWVEMWMYSDNSFVKARVAINGGTPESWATVHTGSYDAVTGQLYFTNQCFTSGSNLYIDWDAFVVVTAKSTN